MVPLSAIFTADHGFRRICPSLAATTLLAADIACPASRSHAFELVIVVTVCR
jgi:hypothetical protein